MSPTLRCSLCGTRAAVQLNDTQLHMLELQNFITRVCPSCGGTTNWEPSFSEASHPGSSHGPAAPRLLLIDDDAAILQVLEKAFSSLNWEVETAGSARAAAMLLTRTDYDVIVSDIRMPGFDGTQLFEFLDRHLPEYRPKVIFLTGDTGTASTMEFLQRTGAPYLTKPVDLNALIDLACKTKSAQSS